MNGILVYLWWVLRGLPKKRVIGGHCGCCGTWMPDEVFKFPDYHKVSGGDLWSICRVCLSTTNFRSIQIPIHKGF